MTLDAIADRIHQDLNKSIEHIKANHARMDDELNTLWHNLMQAQADLLDRMMTDAGKTPVHKDTMIENRVHGDAPGNFYRHIHAAEDLTRMYPTSRR